jgi:hypothetical protein
MRNKYDKSHQIHHVGRVGKVKTLDIIPVVAGESLDLSIDGIIRMTPYRREMVTDAQIDICGFYRPHRHSYGDDWIQFIKDGVDTSVTFSGKSTGAGASLDSGMEGPFLIKGNPSTIPLWLYDGYIDIYNRYYKVPTDQDRAFSWDEDTLSHGMDAARLPRPWTTGVDFENPDSNRDLNSSDWQVPVSGTLDIRALEQVQKRYTSEIQRTWFANRYNDVLDQVFGSTVNTDADQRPEMLFRKTMSLSGVEIDGTDDATLGSFVGKTVERLDCGMGRRYFDEHGSVWIMATVRFPEVRTHEEHLLLRTSSPTYKQISGDPTVLSAEPPIEVTMSNYANNNTNTISGLYEPYGQWYRDQPNVVHQKFYDLPGYPFEASWPVNDNTSWYVNSGSWDTIFQTKMLEHFQIHAMVNCTSLSPVPDPRTSIFAGEK